MTTCVVCTATLTGRQQRYCSPLCASRALNAARAADGRLAEYRRRDDVLQRNRERLSHPEMVAWRRTYRQQHLRQADCAACGTPFTCTADNDRTLCGDLICRSYAARGCQWPTSRIPWVNCPTCARPRVWREGGAAHCVDCRGARPAPWNPSRGKRLRIYRRDEWSCQLCLEPVDRGSTSGDWAPSLDHITPRACGGTHDDDNLRLAHRWCNAIRADGRIPDSAFRAA